MLVVESILDVQIVTIVTSFNLLSTLMPFFAAYLLVFLSVFDPLQVLTHERSLSKLYTPPPLPPDSVNTHILERELMISPIYMRNRATGNTSSSGLVCCCRSWHEFLRALHLNECICDELASTTANSFCRVYI